MNVHLGLLKADVEFVWWWWWVVCKVIFVSNPTKVVRLCCVVVGVGVGVGVVTIIENLSLPSEVDGWKMLN